MSRSATLTTTAVAGYGLWSRLEKAFSSLNTVFQANPELEAVLRQTDSVRIASRNPLI